MVVCVCVCVDDGGGWCVCVFVRALMCQIVFSGVGGSIQDYTLFSTSDYDAALSKSPSCVHLGLSMQWCGL